MEKPNIRSTPKVLEASDAALKPLSLTAALLVGGESRRMGANKALLRCSTGEPLWSRQLGILRALRPERIFISARAVPAWCPAGIEVVLDTPPSRGPLSGICACLELLKTTHLMVLAVDMPQMTPDHLANLFGLAQPGQSLIPQNGAYFEPLCGIYSRSAKSLARVCLTSRDNSLQQFARRLVAEKLATRCPLSAADKALYVNLNNPDDLTAMSL